MGEDAKENNCFWTINVEKKTETARSQNEVFLYDEAEPLAYGCSETSLPPKIKSKTTSSNRFVRTEKLENTISPSDKSLISVVCGNKSQYFSVQSLPKLMKKGSYRNNMQRNGPEKSNVVVVDNFQNAILCKYNEFSNSSKSLVQRRTEYFKNSTDECENTDNSLSSVKIASKKRSSKVREIFSRKSPIFVTSSDSDFGQSLEKQLDDVFSTGASEVSDEVNRSRSKTANRTAKLLLDGKNSDVQWLTSKSILKMAMGDKRVKRETHDNTKRVCPPVRKLSIKRMNSNATPCLLVEEIKRNNLVMKEEIFFSDKSRNPIGAEPLHHEKFNEVEEKDHERTDQQSPKGKNGAVEVFEAKGSSRRRGETKTPETKLINTVQPHSGSFESAPLIQRAQIQPTECAERKARGNTEQVKKVRAPTNVGISQLTSVMKSIGINTEESVHPNSLPNAHSSSESKSSKVITPTSRSSRYVKLPGFPEAFVRDDKCVQELRIKDGLSFESVNHFSNSKNVEVIFLEERAAAEDDPLMETERKKCTMVMIDESTGFESPMEHRLTQTSNDMLINNMMADISVQCDSRIIDPLNDISDYKNDHQEIMICDDNGTGVQLYNILGHPLTDMDGYLLKDSHGRFLVKFDNFGVPTTCTDGKTVFLEDGTKWEHMKGYFNIIHQRAKKKVPKTPAKSRLKSNCQHRSRRPFDPATSTNELEWLGEISTYDALSNSYSGQRNTTLRNYHNPLRNIKLKPDSGNMYDNTSNLVAEMKSIAKLRNALLEKINFIADHRGPQKPRFSRRNETRSFKSIKRSDIHLNSTESNWKSEPRLNLDSGRIQRNHRYKYNRMIKKRKDTDEDPLLINTTTHHLHPHAATLRLQETQGMFPATTSVWHPEPPAILHSSNTTRWPSNDLTILRDENFPPISDHSAFEPWSDVSRSNSHIQSLAERTRKWSAMMPSIEGDSDEHDFL